MSLTFPLRPLTVFHTLTHQLLLPTLTNPHQG